MRRLPLRHLVIPDTQCAPGVPLQHLEWASKAIAEYRPDRVIHLGDHWDMHSLSSYDKPGSASREGARYKDDIEVGNVGMRLLTKHFLTIPDYRPDMHFLTGNHEQRIERALEDDPRLEGVIGYDDFEMCGFQRHPFLRVVWLDGVAYSHYFQNVDSSRAIAGSVDNRLNKIGSSFVQGHAQGFRYGNRSMPTGRTYHGVVAGSFYQHDESYKGEQGNGHWRGLLILNDVHDGHFDVMPLSMDYLRRKYGEEE